MKSVIMISNAVTLLSLLSWERGLKLINEMIKVYDNAVAPLVGAWIEITIAFLIFPSKSVAPLVGAWIEIV